MFKIKSQPLATAGQYIGPIICCIALISPIAEAEDSDDQKAESYWKAFDQDHKQEWDSAKHAFRDGWIEGKLETALVLNKHLASFQIDVSAKNNVATLEGKVSNDIQQELAEQVALGVEGVDSVDNNIIVKPGYAGLNITEYQRTFSQYIDDVTITATIKTELLNSRNTQDLDINIKTENSMVTFSGVVNTVAKKTLVEHIAKNIDGVAGVINNIEVVSAT